jgi:thiol-disulfide isomerase/thioredoxin
MSWVIVAVVALFGGAAFVARADEPAAVAGGETAPASSAELPSARSLDGQDVSFADLLGGDGKAVCYAFLHPTCPLAQRYAPVLAELDKEFDEQGVHFVGVVCEFDDVDEITGYRDEYAIHFPFLTDRDFHLADALDATTTPEVVLVDAGGRIRYQGRIDDRYKVRGEKSPGTPEPDLKNAILDLLAGREVQLPVTEAVGCPLDRPEVPTTPPQPHHEITYAEDVLPFLHAQCQRCHSPGQAGPFTLTSYDDAVDWMEQAIEEIEARRMPPAQVESDFELLDTKPPTAEQLAMLREWVKTDMPAGDPAKTPKLPPLPDYGAFQEDLGPPDIVLEQQSPTQLGAHGEDLYRNVIFSLGNKEDLAIRALQFLPGNRAIVHHALTGYLPRESGVQAIADWGGRDGMSHPDDQAGGWFDPHGLGFRPPPFRDDGIPRTSFVGGYVPGVRAGLAPPDAVYIVPAGSDLTAQVHYARTGKTETDSSRIGIWLADDAVAADPRRKLMNIIYLTGRFGVVPAGVKDFRVKGTYTLPHDAELVSITPHTHLLAQWFEVWARLPGEEKPQLVVRVPKWDYNWQCPYVLETPQPFPAGTRFEVECSYNNSEANPQNPFSPPQSVWHSEQVTDEMVLPMILFTSKTPLDPAGRTFFKFYSEVVRSSFLQRLVDRRHKYVSDAEGNVTLSPDFKDGHQDEHKSEHQHEHKAD